MGKEIQNYDAEYAKRAAEYAESEAVTGGQFITTKGGVLRFDDTEMPGNQIAVVIVDSVWENTFYTDRFDDENPMPPTCYAFARGDQKDEMAPHPSMQDHAFFEPQSVDCATCPKNEWGSADPGRGKACQNRRRLALLPAGFYDKKRGSRDFDLTLVEDEKHYKSADLAFLKLPVTSVKDYSKYVQYISATLNKPPFGVVTRIWAEPDSKSQYKLRFELVEELPDWLAPTIFSRNDEARKTIITPYAGPREEERPKRGGRGRDRDDRDDRRRDDTRDSRNRR